MTERTTLLIARVLAFVGLSFWAYYVLRQIFGLPLFLNTEGESQLVLQIAFGVYGYAVLLVGVFLGAVYQATKAVKAAGIRYSVRSTVKRAMRGADFWLGVFASPVVYAVLLQAVDMTHITTGGLVGLTLVGLQNGFVCNTLADSMMSGRVPAQATANISP